MAAREQGGGRAAASWWRLARRVLFMEVLMGSGVTTPVLSPVMRAGGTRGIRKQIRRSDQCWEVTEADLNMYGMIVGRSPSEAEKLEALTRARRRQEMADARAAEVEHRKPAATGWSPMVLCDYLKGICDGSVQFRIGGPVISAWVRNLSMHARHRLLETQARLATPRAK